MNTPYELDGESPVEVAKKRMNAMEKKMIIPEMPKGYYLMQDTGFWYVLKDEGVGMKRLLDKDGNEKRFEPNSNALFHAAVYAKKHKASGLSYNQEVSEV